MFFYISYILEAFYHNEKSKGVFPHQFWIQDKDCIWDTLLMNNNCEQNSNVKFCHSLSKTFWKSYLTPTLSELARINGCRRPHPCNALSLFLESIMVRAQFIGIMSY